MEKSLFFGVGVPVDSNVNHDEHGKGESIRDKGRSQIGAKDVRCMVINTICSV